jgi:outer membrane beta-barrel protein
MKRHLVGISILFLSLSAHAVDIQFPEEELARESVYPVFDNPEAVKHRTVDTAGRIELGLGGGWSLNDALFDPLTFGGSVTYHFNELHAAQFYGTFFSAKPSQYVQGIEEDGKIANLANAPQPKYLMLLNYQITPYYGKISITKQTVLNLSTYGSAGLGTININGENIFAWSIGLGQKLYFNRNWGIQADLKAVTYSAPNAFSYNGPEAPSLPADRVPTNAEFGKQSFTNGIITVGAVYLL